MVLDSAKVSPFQFIHLSEIGDSTANEKCAKNYTTCFRKFAYIYVIAGRGLRHKRFIVSL